MAPPLTREQLDDMRRVHVGPEGPHTSQTCYKCWEKTCPVPALFETINAVYRKGFQDGKKQEAFFPGH